MAQHLTHAGNGMLTSANNCFGFSLLEVMISAVILTVSLLGVAGMYGFSSQFSYEARQYSLASNISKHILDDVKINKEKWSELFSLHKDGRGIKINIDNSVSNEINNVQYSLVATDIQSFRQHLKNSFSHGHACIVINLINENDSDVIALDVNINWRLGANANSDNICYIHEPNKDNKNYHISAIL